MDRRAILPTPSRGYTRLMCLRCARHGSVRSEKEGRLRSPEPDCYPKEAREQGHQPGLLPNT